MMWPTLIDNSVVHADNPILELIERVETLTQGLCDVGVGPGGFGVGNNNLSKVGLVISQTPPHSFDVQSLEIDQHITLTIEPYLKENAASLNDEQIRTILKNEPDEKTAVICQAALALFTRSIEVTDEEYEAAYHVVAERMLAECVKKTATVGRVNFVNGETQEFTDAEEYLQCIREELPYHATTGFRYETLTDDSTIRKAVDDILYDLYGEENPRPLEDYEDTPEQGITMGGL